MYLEQKGPPCKTTATPQIEYHADDYGLFPAQSRRILNCHQNGALNGISVIPNSPHLAECMEFLRPCKSDLTLAIHLNFMEGKALTPGLLTNRDGNFRMTFGTLLLHSFLPGKSAYRAALKSEIRAQIHAVLPYLEGSPLRIDSHAHYHMIPVVFDALMDVIQEEKVPVAYIRVPKDPIGLYLRHWNELTGFRPVNLVKVLVLDLLAWRNERKYEILFKNLEHRIFLGVLFSGNMCFQNVSAILPEVKALEARKGWNATILAHPGGVYEDADAAELTHIDDIAFLTSDGRRQEAEMLCKLQEDT